MRKALTLDVAAWAALISAETAEPFGAAEAASVIPAGQRRRLPAFTRDVLRCALPLLRDRPLCPIIFASPYGDLASTVTLLTDVAQRQLLSPSLFGLSVHNAPMGALSLCVDQPGDQTALSGGGGSSLAGGLTETYARLIAGGKQSILLCYADERLPPAYAEFDDEAPGVILAMILQLSGQTACTEAAAQPERQGAANLVHALAAGATRLSWTPPRIQAAA